MKRISLAQLRDMLLAIQEEDANTIRKLKGYYRSPFSVKMREAAFTRFTLIEAIEQAFEGDTALLQTYLLEGDK